VVVSPLTHCFVEQCINPISSPWIDLVAPTGAIMDGFSRQLYGQGTFGDQIVVDNGGQSSGDGSIQATRVLDHLGKRNSSKGMIPSSGCFEGISAREYLSSLEDNRLSSEETHLPSSHVHVEGGTQNK